MDGWVKIHRQMSENDLWTCEPFSRGQAWVDMILLANHKPNFFYKRGVKVNVERGQLAWSELALSERWKWSRNKVRKFLKDLEKEHQIEQQKTNVTQVVTIKNYDKFQEKDTKQNTKRTPKGHQKDTNKNDKNEKNIEERKSDFKELIKKVEAERRSDGQTPYSEQMLKDFFEHWSEYGVNDKKMRYEKQVSFCVKRRLSNWKRNSKKFDTQKDSVWVPPSLPKL